VGQRRVPEDFLITLPIPLPPISELRRITAILNDQMAAVERARVATEAQLDTANALPTAYLRAVFNSPEAQQWPKKKIGEIARVLSGYAFKSEWFAGEGIRLLRNANVFQGYIAWDDEVRLPLGRRPDFKAYELSVGDIVLSLDRPVVSKGLKVARITLDDLPALLLQRVGRFQLRGTISSGYLYSFLNSPSFIAAITEHDQSIGMPHVSPAQVEAVILPLPPLAEQGRIASRLAKQMAQVDRLSESLQSQLDVINKLPAKLPAALLRRAFRGELG
jgi:type I restriction enzyme S subunit